MKKLAILILASIPIAATASAAQQTMRVDFYHTGNAADEHYSLDQVLIEPLPWPATPRGRSIRPTAASTSSKSSTRPAARFSTRAASARSTANGKRQAKR